ncbi:MAG: type I restriction-modification system subunit M, partial [Chloroflexota bacterium]|nr:type I restriction-modification system subunit M [Chloroflexota bacterium]
MVQSKKGEKNGANLGFEEKLWLAADKMRSHMDAAEYKHVVLGLIFLKYISDAYLEKRAELESIPWANPDDPDEFLADNIFIVPKEALWNGLQARAKTREIGLLIDDAMTAIENKNVSLKGVLPKTYGRRDLDTQRLGELVDLISGIGLGDKESRSKDILGRVYEYFLSKFASAEGKNGGEFYTPQAVVRLLVEMIEPYMG